MLKYLNTFISMQEVPGEIAMIFEVSGCPHRCDGCHSVELWGNNGQDLTVEKLIFEIKHYKDFITCICFFGGEWDLVHLNMLLKKCRDLNYKTCLYTGASDVSSNLRSHLDYLKTGRWNDVLGGLNSPATNQKFINLNTGECLNHIFQKSHKQGERNVEIESGTNNGKN